MAGFGAGVGDDCWTVARFENSGAAAVVGPNSDCIEAAGSLVDCVELVVAAVAGSDDGAIIFLGGGVGTCASVSRGVGADAVEDFRKHLHPCLWPKPPPLKFARAFHIQQVPNHETE